MDLRIRSRSKKQEGKWLGMADKSTATQQKKEQKRMEAAFRFRKFGHQEDHHQELTAQT